LADDALDWVTERLSDWPEGKLDDVSIPEVRRFENEFFDYLRRSYGGLLTAIRETNDLTDDNVNTLKEATDRFRRTFEVTGGQLLVASDEAVPALGEGEDKQESIARYEPSAPAEEE